MTLLLPQDAHLALGHAVSRVGVPLNGLTCAALLGHIADYYSQPVELDDHTAALLRGLQGGRPQAGQYVPRAALLGSRLAVEAVLRATRDPVGCVYEVCLGM